MDKSLGIVSFETKGENESIFDEEQWHETMTLDEISEEVNYQVPYEEARKDVKSDLKIMKKELNTTLSQFQETVFGQMEKQQMFMENMFQSVREEFDQYHTKMKMIKEEVFSEIKQEIEIHIVTEKILRIFFAKIVVTKMYGAVSNYIFNFIFSGAQIWKREVFSCLLAL